MVFNWKAKKSKAKAATTARKKKSTTQAKVLPTPSTSASTTLSAISNFGLVPLAQKKTTKTKAVPFPSTSASTSLSTPTISNVGLLPLAQKLQSDLRTHQKELLDVTQSIKALNARKKEIETQINNTKSELKLLSEREGSLVEFGRNDFEWSADMWHKLETVFNIKEFRSQQLVAINATMSKVDCLLIMPTGGGKSLCFQLPALLSPGITLVVSPLISLMEDQQESLRSLSIPSAIFNSNTSKEEASSILKSLSIHSISDLKILYVTPEKIAKSKRLMSNLEKLYSSGGFARLVIDEVHCCSTWGHDFRPDYKFLNIMKKQFPNTPILGLTATATTAVIVDVQKMLNIESSLVFKDTFFRPSLIYEVLDCTTKDKIQVLERIIRKRFKPTSSGIIYCLTVKDTEEVSKELREAGIRASPYHASLTPEVRSETQAKWYKNDVQCIVATIAFGMGINKLDLEYVVHYSMSKSIENYYQESGRAGRDGRDAYCILLFNIADLFRTTQIMMTEKHGTRNAYNMLKYSLDRKNCRKKFMAEHFGDAWNDAEDLCKKHCDNCVAKISTLKPDQLNVKPLLDDLIKIIENADDAEQRMTQIKLMSALYRTQGNAKLRVDDVQIPKFPKEVCEHVLGQLVLDGYLKEEFHFTAYSTISYIVPGDRLPTNLFYDVYPLRTKSIVWNKNQKNSSSSPPTQSTSSLAQKAGPSKSPHVNGINFEQTKYVLQDNSSAAAAAHHASSLAAQNKLNGPWCAEDFYNIDPVDSPVSVPVKPKNGHEMTSSTATVKEEIATSSNSNSSTFKNTATAPTIEVVDLSDDDDEDFVPSGPSAKKFKFSKKDVPVILNDSH